MSTPDGTFSRRTLLAALPAGALVARIAHAADAESKRDVSWLGEVQRAPANIPADAPRLSNLLVDSAGKPIESLAGWQTRRSEIRSDWERFLGVLQLDRTTPKLEVLEEDRPEGCVRQRVRYETEPGLAIEAYLIKPAKITGKVPGVLALHQTTDHTIRQPAGLDDPPEYHFGLRLARRGMVSFSPRCFLWNDKPKDLRARVVEFHERHPKSLGMAKMLWDAIRGVDVLVAQPEVDPARIGAVGHSLGAKEAMYVAAFDERVKAAVSSDGGIGMKFTNWHDPWYLGESVRNGQWQREHHEVLALIAPRAYLLIAGQSADGDASWPFFAAALPVYNLYGGTSRVGMFNHRQGHAMPPVAEAKLYEWLVTYL